MLAVSTATVSDNVIVRLAGVLNIGTYRQVRDAVTKAVLGQPAAVIVDVDNLDVPDNQGWAVFAAARWQVDQSPDVPIALVSGDSVVRERLAPLAITQYVPVFADVAAAAAALREGSCRYRRRARAVFARHDGGLRAAQMFVRNHLAEWSMFDKIPLTSTVATIFIENASSYGGDGCDLRLEGSDEEVFIAVSDVGKTADTLRDRMSVSISAGLDLVAALCPRSGSTPTYGGRIGWARIGSDATHAAIGRLLN